MIEDFKNKIELLVAQIRGIAKLELTAYEFKEPLSTYKIEQKEEEYGLRLTNAIKAFYRVCGRLRLKWKLRDPRDLEIDFKGSVEGSVNILDIDTVIMGFDGRHWLNELWTEKMSESDKAFKKRLKIFDYFGSDNVDAVCLEVKEGALIPELWVNNLDYGAFRLNLDLDDYLQTLLRTRGIWGWQFFYADINWFNSNYGIRNTAEHILKVFPQLFGQEPILKQFEDLYEQKSKS